MAACHKNDSTSKIKGDWKSKDGTTTLKITDKQFTLDNESPVPEDYFVKGDTIFTSFEGNQPYTRFVIEKADEKNLNLLFPDSVTVEFTRYQ
ncbi:hypothetical protein DYU05_14160 [Mucilaginibacter terrenus]|uniref:Lipocalin-like domain-containing protein n=2 Tax=Mucilaginibacter terrenus TaxID=2482727 RepID=A0A3E2NQK4_9SPHI|nr:hypothetical protein DYU05_14160 [Mucilaginibacter terrenus]